jgi:hypothetical protein
LVEEEKAATVPVLHYRQTARPGQSRYFIKCLKDGGYQTWQLTSLGASLLTRIGIYGDGEVSWAQLNLLIDWGYAYLNDPEAAKARWEEKVGKAYATDPKVAAEKYGEILEWLKTKKGDGDRRKASDRAN